MNFVLANPLEIQPGHLTHYEHLTLQYTEIFFSEEKLYTRKCHQKRFDIFNIFAQNVD